MVRPIDYAALTERQCTKCKKTKPVAEFNRYNDPKQPINGWRYYAWCRECQRQASRDYGTSNRAHRNARLSAWRKQNPQAALANEQRKRMKHKYGMTEEQVAAMFEAQSGKCALCGEEKPLCVDHDHDTGKVRGGLCNRCNIVLGRYEGNISAPNALTEEMVAKIRAYLANPPADSLPADGEPDHCHGAALLAIANGVTP
jgi:hypothetical protein